MRDIDVRTLAGAEGEARAAGLFSLIGTEVGVSAWHAMPQARIDTFADATEDHQWIHTDAARCKIESPFGAPVAHGFLTLSMIPALFENAIRLVGAKLVLNYGLNKVRFPAPVPVDSRVRARITLLAVDAFDGGEQLTWQVVIECDASAKPVCVAEMLMRRY
ncbi:MaoC family dehydratase [Massilia sp. DWR3-1-1]|uniref:MaoC family dehydratase n=1 Tax=Massilia sp. DWR3-1-1 TaxID=2804559 RepID=UPI003CFA20EB